VDRGTVSYKPNPSRVAVPKLKGNLHLTTKFSLTHITLRFKTISQHVVVA